MPKIFIIQLIVTFIVGGSFIAFLSFLAEKASEKVAGLIISLPSTVAISFFFIGWALSPQEIGRIAPIVPVGTAAVLMFTITYLYLSKLKMPKKWSILLCLSGSLLVWFACAVPLAVFEFSNLWISLGIYVIFAVISYFLLTIKPKVKEIGVFLKYSALQKVFRALFAGFIVTLAVFLAKVLGPFWGGVFAIFPAVFMTTLLILHWNYDSNFLFRVWKNSPLGTLVFVVYSVIAMYSFPEFGIVWGSILAYGGALGAFLVLKGLKK